MANFKLHVQPIVHSKLLALAQLGMEYINEIRFPEIVISCENVGEIQGNYVSGWIPMQDGGYSASAYFDDRIDAVSFCKSQKDAQDSQYSDMLESFKSEHGHAEIDYDDESICDSLYEYENDWYSTDSECLLTFRCYVQEDGTIRMTLTVNYLDAPYYREKHDTLLWSNTLEESEFIALDNNAIVASILINKEA